MNSPWSATETNIFQQQYKKNSFLSFDSLFKRILIACFIYIMNMAIIVMLQILFFTDNKYMKFYSIIICLICQEIYGTLEFFVFKESKEYFLMINSIIYNLTLCVLIVFFDNDLTYWMPMFYMKHYINTFFANSCSHFITNEIINYVCVGLFCFHYDFTFLVLLLFSSFFYSLNPFVGIQFLIVNLFNWRLSFIDNILLRILLTCCEILILVILNKITMVYTYLLKKEWYLSRIQREVGNVSL